MRRIVIPLVMCAPLLAHCQQTLSVLKPSGASSAPMLAALSGWCSDVSTATKQRVRCREIDGDAGIDPQAAVVDGRFDVGVIAHSRYRAQYPISRIADLPLLGNFAETTSTQYQILFDHTPRMADEHRKLHVLAVFTQAPGRLFFSGRAPANAAELEARSSVDVLQTTSTDIEASGQPRRFDSAAEVDGGAFNVSYAFVVNEARWKQIDPIDRAALATLSGGRAAATFGAAFDAAEWKANVRQRGEGTRFVEPTDRLASVLRARAARIDHDWIVQAESAKLPSAARVLARFRADNRSRESAE